MFSYKTIDSTPEALYQGMIIPVPDDIPEPAKPGRMTEHFEIGEYTITVKMDISSELDDLWEYFGIGYEDYWYYDPEQVAQNCREQVRGKQHVFNHQLKRYEDEARGSTTPGMQRMDSQRWQIRLQVFLAACKRTATREAMKYIAQVAPKNADGSLRAKGVTHIALLAYVNTYADSYELLAKNTAENEITILLESCNVNHISMDNAYEDVSVKTDFFRNFAIEEAASTAAEAQVSAAEIQNADAAQEPDALQGDVCSAKEEELPEGLTIPQYSRQEKITLNDELTITVPDGYHGCTYGEGDNAGWCYIVPKDVPLSANHIDAKPYSFAVTSAPIGEFPFEASKLQATSDLLVSNGLLQAGIIVDTVLCSAHCAFLYQNFYDSNDLTYSKVKGFLVTNKSIYMMHTYANYDKTIADDEKVIDHFLQVSRAWMERVSLLSDTWMIRPVEGKQVMKSEEKTSPAVKEQQKSETQMPSSTQHKQKAQPISDDGMSENKPANVQTTAEKTAKVTIVGINENNDVNMYVILTNEKKLGKLKRSQKDFCEIYGEDFPELSKAKIIQLRKEVIAELEDESRCAYYADKFMRRTFENRFKCATLNLNNVSEEQDMEVRAEWAIENTKEWFSEAEQAQVRRLMRDEHNKIRRDIDAQLSKVDESWKIFETARYFLQIVITDKQEDKSDIKSGAGNFQVFIDDQLIEVQIATKNLMRISTTVMDYFTWYWGVTVRDIWEAAAVNEFKDKRVITKDGDAVVKQAMMQIRTKHPETKFELPKAPIKPEVKLEHTVYPPPTVSSYTQQTSNPESSARQSQPAQKEGCYIATAVYGSYDAPEVITLRRFRDETLKKTALGRWFIRTYYRLSPPVANKLKHAKHINAIVRSVLNRLVEKIDYERHGTD